MSGIINSYFIEPALRQARRFSTTPDAVEDQSAASASQATLPLRRRSLLREQAVDSSAVAENDELPVTEADVQSELLSADRRRLPEGETAVGARLIQRYDPLAAAVEMDPQVVQSLQPPEPVASEASQYTGIDLLQMDRPNIQNTNSRSLPTNFSVTHEPAPLNRRQDLPPNVRDSPSFSSPLSRSLSESHERQNSSSSSAGFSGTLPANDGMNVLREKLHQIRDMALSSEEKAQRIHALMNADYNEFRMRQREGPLTSNSSRRSSRGGSLRTPTRSVLQLTSMDIPDAKSLELRRQYNVKAADLRPTFRPHSPTLDAIESGEGEDDEEEEEEMEFGCKHYTRNVKIQCSDCRNWYTCRHCHDEAEDHLLARKRIASMMCMFCGLPQPAGEFCKGCDETAALYYCDICKLWDNDPRSRIYHCEDCGICRRGEGLGKDFVHCKRCNVCISIRWAETHRCVERATDCDCPICGEYMFTSSTSVVAMKCGHYIHRNCYDAYMQSSYKCPICNRSAVNMELQWRKLDQAIETQPMPEQYQHSRALIICNDCNIRSETRYHWLGLKCLTCDSYNTQELRVTNIPGNSEEPFPQMGSEQESGQHPALVERDLVEHHQSPTPVDHEHAIQPILDFRAHSPLPDAFAASALEDPSQPVTNDLDVSSGHTAAKNMSPESPQIAGTTVFGSPSSATGLMAGPSTHTRSVSTPSQAPEPYFHGDNSPFWGDSISPSALLHRIGSPVLTRIGSPVWSSPRLFGSNASAQGDTTNERRRSESDDEEDYFIDEDEGGGFGWGISPSGWGISPPAFFAERFLGRGRTNQVDKDGASNLTKDELAASDGQSESESVSEVENEPEECEVEEESEFFQLPGHR